MIADRRSAQLCKWNKKTNVARSDSLSRVFQARPRQPLLNG